MQVWSCLVAAANAEELCDRDVDWLGLWVSVSHANAEELFDRDVECIIW
jgi:hypothetical protein